MPFVTACVCVSVAGKPAARKKTRISNKAPVITHRPAIKNPRFELDGVSFPARLSGIREGASSGANGIFAYGCETTDTGVGGGVAVCCHICPGCGNGVRGIEGKDTCSSSAKFFPVPSVPTGIWQRGQYFAAFVGESGKSQCLHLISSSFTHVNVSMRADRSHIDYSLLFPHTCHYRV